MKAHSRSLECHTKELALGLAMQPTGRALTQHAQDPRFCFQHHKIKQVWLFLSTMGNHRGSRSREQKSVNRGPMHDGRKGEQKLGKSNCNADMRHLFCSCPDYLYIY